MTGTKIKTQPNAHGSLWMKWSIDRNFVILSDGSPVLHALVDSLGGHGESFSYSISTPETEALLLQLSLRCRSIKFDYLEFICFRMIKRRSHVNRSTEIASLHFSRPENDAGFLSSNAISG